MIDLHCHILPGVDDGAKDMEESLTLAMMYVEAGFTHVAATPHCVPGTFEVPDPKEILAKVAELNRALKAENIPLAVLQGMEIGIDPELLQLLDQKRILTLGGSKTLLLETPFQRLPQGWQQVLFDLKSRGYNILMGHPERSDQLFEEPELCAKLVDMGAYLQVTWNSLLGNNGPAAKRLSYYIIQRDYCHVLATDSHNPHSRNPENVTEGVEKMNGRFGTDNLTLLCRNNPIRILRDMVPEPMPPMMDTDQPAEISIWQKWFKKLLSL